MCNETVSINKNPYDIDQAMCKRERVEIRIYHKAQSLRKEADKLEELAKTISLLPNNIEEQLNKYLKID